MRLMSPSDLGRRLRPFVFLDLFDGPSSFAGAIAVHPHSGIATVTVITEGDVRYDNPDAGAGTIGYGGVEWMRAGGGVWHGQEMSAGVSDRLRGSSSGSRCHPIWRTDRSTASMSRHG